MHSLQELISQRDAIEAKIRDAQLEAKAGSIKMVLDIMRENGLTVDDLGSGKVHKVGKAKSRLQGVPLAPKYRDKLTGQTWTGRGLQPRWLRDKLLNGATLEQFKIAA